MGWQGYILLSFFLLTSCFKEHSFKDYFPDNTEAHETEHNLHEHNHYESHEHRNRNEYIIETLVSTLCISVFPIFIILLIPLTTTINGKPTINKSRLRALLAFAVGGLLGDVFLHLLPHALGDNSEADHNHNHTEHNEHNHNHHTSIGLQVLGGMLCFFLIEKLAVIHGAGNDHGHSHGKAKGQRNKREESKEEREAESDKITRERLKITAILNIIADTVHNMTDGMAIAASFMEGQTIGIGTTIAVMLHEIPHEIGDLAILVQSGMSKKEVIKIQFLTAIGAIVGALFGLVLGIQSSSSWIIPFTAGGFIYVATADVIPQLFEKTNLVQTLKEIISMCLGVGAMLLIVYYE